MTVRLLTSVAMILISACSNPTVDVSEVLNHSLCRNIRSGVHPVEFADLAGIRGSRLLQEPGTDTGAEPHPSAETASASDPGIVLIAISRGSQPTPGYGFKLSAVKRAEYNNGYEVRLEYHWLTPSSDAVMAQMVTSPCSVVELQGASRVNAVSAWIDDELLGRIELDEHPN